MPLGIPTGVVLNIPLVNAGPYSCGEWAKDVPWGSRKGMHFGFKEALSVSFGI